MYIMYMYSYVVIRSTLATAVIGRGGCPLGGAPGHGQEALGVSGGRGQLGRAPGAILLSSVAQILFRSKDFFQASHALRAAGGIEGRRRKKKRRSNVRRASTGRTMKNDAIKLGVD